MQFRVSGIAAGAILDIKMIASPQEWWDTSVSTLHPDMSLPATR
jgi:hypothetical protein